jgi:signal transduction histidine kinase
MDNLSQEVSIIYIASLFLILVAVGIVTLVMVYRRRQVEYIHEQNRLKTAFEKELLEAQLEIQEQTMKHIAQEIHDNIGGTLTLAKLNLNTIPRDQQGGATEKITNTKELVTKAIADLRTLSKTLHTEAVLSLGIVKAIEMELKMVDKAGAMDTLLTVSGEPIPIDQQKELILFRTTQEALNNAIKHSGATQIEVDLSYCPDTLQLTIADNGQGFDRTAIEQDPDKGSGLRNMQNRTKLIGGNLSIDGSKGTRIQITLPIIAA